MNVGSGSWWNRKAAQGILSRFVTHRAVVGWVEHSETQHDVASHRRVLGLILRPNLLTVPYAALYLATNDAKNSYDDRY
jgi:hypothetical protein